MFQIVDRGIDLVQRVTMRDQLVQFEFPLAIPAKEDRKIAIRLAVAAAGAGKRAITDEQTRV